MYGARNPPEEPPCDTCKPETIEENVQAIEIFYLTRNQLIMSMNGPIDIMHEPIYRAMDLHNVKNRKACFYKVLSMSRDWISSMGNK